MFYASCGALPSYLNISINRQRLKNDCLLLKLHIMSKTESRHFGMRWNTVLNDNYSSVSIKITIWIGIMMLASFISNLMEHWRTQVEMSLLSKGGLTGSDIKNQLNILKYSTFRLNDSNWFHLKDRSIFGRRWNRSTAMNIELKLKWKRVDCQCEQFSLCATTKRIHCDAEWLNASNGIRRYQFIKAFKQLCHQFISSLHPKCTDIAHKVLLSRMYGFHYLNPSDTEIAYTVIEIKYNNCVYTRVAFCVVNKDVFKFHTFTVDSRQQRRRRKKVGVLSTQRPK